MRSRLKKSLVVILTAVMVLGIMPVQAVRAEEQITVTETVAETEKTPAETSEEEVLQEEIAEDVTAENVGISGEEEMIETEEKDNSGEETGSEDAEDEEDREDDEELLLNYLVVDKPYVELGETQSIVISLGDSDTYIDGAVLYYYNNDTGVISEIAASNAIGDGILFEKTFTDESQSGQYILDSLAYLIGEEVYTIRFFDIGINASFGVNTEVETEADGEIVDDDESGDSSALEETPEIEYGVVSFDENGEQISENSIKDALLDSAADAVATDTLYASGSSGNIVIVLDPGHDSTHIGASANGLHEEQLTYKIALYCKAELENYAGVTVYLTRGEACPYPGTSSGDCNINRVNYAKSVGANAYISIHLNSSSSASAKGAEVYYPNANYNQYAYYIGNGLAEAILTKLAALGLNNRGTKIKNSSDTTYPDGSVADYYSVIRNSKLNGIAGIIIEHAFITNADDASLLSSEYGLMALGVADANGIVAYCGLQQKAAIELSNVSLTADSLNLGDSIGITYTTNKVANVKVEVYDGNNNYLKTISSESDASAGTHIATWDGMGTNGDYVDNGTFRFTVTATDADGNTAVEHRWFQVTGEKPFIFKWVNLTEDSYQVGDNATLYYATNKDATIRIDIYDGNNNFFRTLIDEKNVGTNDQVDIWKLTDRNGAYVEDDTYRFTITATDASGNTITVHKWFKTTGNPPFAFKWTNLTADIYTVGDSAKLYYATNRSSVVAVEVYREDNTYLTTLEPGKSIGTNDQVITWDMKDTDGSYVENGRYRFTITAVDKKGTKIVAHTYFNTTGNDPFAFKWTNMSNDTANVSQGADLYYATNRPATVTIEVYRGDNSYLATLMKEKSIGTNDQVITWDMLDVDGSYVENGEYRFTITAVDKRGTEIVAHKYFNTTGNDSFEFKWTNMSSSTADVSEGATLYYATNRPATVTIEVYRGDNSYLATLVKEKSIGTNDQVITWDMLDSDGNYVYDGKYRFTLTATDSRGNKVVAHKYFETSGNPALAFKWTNLDVQSDGAYLYYAVNKSAYICIDMYYENNNYMKNLISYKQVETNDQVCIWNYTDESGIDVSGGKYRFTISAYDLSGEEVTSHVYVDVPYVYMPIMGTGETTVSKMVNYYNSKATYPTFYLTSDAPTIETFCQIYYEECYAEGVKPEVAFCQAMLETGFLKYGGDVSITQYNFAGLGATGGGNPGNSYSSVREGVRAQVQHLKAYASTDALNQACVDSRFSYVTRGSAPYVEWLGISENPYGKGWATAQNYGYNIRNKYISVLYTY